MLAVALCVLIGFAVGVLSGMLGVGGGMMMLPIFRLGFGMSALQTTATSLFAIVPTSLAGSVTHLRNKTCIPIVGIVAGVAGACTSPLGVHLANMSPAWLVMATAAFVIGYSAVKMLRKAISLPKPNAEEGASAPSTEIAKEDGGSGQQAPENADGKRPRIFKDRKMVMIALAIGLVTGVASGYIGVGGGFLMIPLFTGLLGLGMKKASGTSLIAVSILAIPGVVEQIMLGNVIVEAGLAMAAGSIPGAIVGASLSKRVPERSLRFLFSILLFASAVMLAFKELGV